MSDGLESHSSGSASLRLAADGSPNGLSSTTCGSNSSVVSVDDVVACPTSLQPVRIVCDENSASKRSKKRHVQHLPAVAPQQHRSSCMFSMYQTVLTCWSDWTADPNFTSRFFFQDSRPVRFIFHDLRTLLLLCRITSISMTGYLFANFSSLQARHRRVSVLVAMLNVSIQ